MRMNSSIARRLEEAEAQSYASAWEGIAPDPARGIDPCFAEIEGARCFRGAASGMEFWNRAYGLGFDEAEPAQEALAAITHFFQPVAGWWVDVNPYARWNRQVLQSLQQAGLRIGSHSNLLASLPGAVPLPAPLTGVEVVRVNQEHLAGFVEVNVRGYEMPPADRELFAVAAANLVRQPGVRAYLALVGGRPASVGELHLHPNGMGFLAGAATLPEFRGRGLQTLLIRIRAAEARRHGCELLGVQTGIGTQSQFNQEANGFRLVYTKTCWRLPREG
jgi:GNAT superfamily N-acetyltransferase